MSIVLLENLPSSFSEGTLRSIIGHVPCKGRVVSHTLVPDGESLAAHVQFDRADDAEAAVRLWDQLTIDGTTISASSEAETKQRMARNVTAQHNSGLRYPFAPMNVSWLYEFVNTLKNPEKSLTMCRLMECLMCNAVTTSDPFMEHAVVHFYTKFACGVWVRAQSMLADGHSFELCRQVFEVIGLIRRYPCANPKSRKMLLTLVERVVDDISKVTITSKASAVNKAIPEIINSVRGCIAALRQKPKAAAAVAAAAEMQKDAEASGKAKADGKAESDEAADADDAAEEKKDEKDKKPIDATIAAAQAASALKKGTRPGTVQVPKDPTPAQLQAQAQAAAAQAAAEQQPLHSLTSWLRLLFTCLSSRREHPPMLPETPSIAPCGEHCPCFTKMKQRYPVFLADVEKVKVIDALIVSAGRDGDDDVATIAKDLQQHYSIECCRRAVAHVHNGHFAILRMHIFEACRIVKRARTLPPADHDLSTTLDVVEIALLQCHDTCTGMDSLGSVVTLVQNALACISQMRKQQVYAQLADGSLTQQQQQQVVQQHLRQQHQQQVQAERAAADQAQTETIDAANDDKEKGQPKAKTEDAGTQADTDVDAVAAIQAQTKDDINAATAAAIAAAQASQPIYSLEFALTQIFSALCAQHLLLCVHGASSGGGYLPSPVTTAPVSMAARSVQAQDLRRKEMAGEPLGDESDDNLPRCGNPQCTQAQGELLKCSACKTTFYCSAACQRADWKAHKTYCRDMQQKQQEQQQQQRKAAEAAAQAAAQATGGMTNGAQVAAAAAASANAGAYAGMTALEPDAKWPPPGRKLLSLPGILRPPQQGGAAPALTAATAAAAFGMNPERTAAEAEEARMSAREKAAEAERAAEKAVEEAVAEERKAKQVEQAAREAAKEAVKKSGKKGKKGGN